MTTQVISFEEEFTSGTGDELTTLFVDQTSADPGTESVLSYGIAAKGYRYGFNGQERSDDVMGEGNHNTALFWEYDPRLGRRWNLDPKPTTGISEYSVLYNSPLNITDPLGDDPGDYYDKQGNHLGKDNVQDDKVYTTDKATIVSNKTQGKTDWTKVQQAPATVDFTKTYAITNSQLLDRANWIYAEGRGSVPLYYAYAIQNSRILNKTEAKVYYWGLQDSEGRLDKNQYFQGTSHSENKNGKAFWDTRNNPSKRTDAMLKTVSAVILSVMNPTLDPTRAKDPKTKLFTGKGATGWLGYGDSQHKGEFHAKVLGRYHFFLIVGQKYGFAPLRTEKEYEEDTKDIK